MAGFLYSLHIFVAESSNASNIVLDLKESESGIFEC
jgi:hypothetical protein